MAILKDTQVTGSFAVTGSMTAPAHGPSGSAQVVGICYGTSATPPDASTVPEGTIYIQYVA